MVAPGSGPRPVPFPLYSSCVFRRDRPQLRLACLGLSLSCFLLGLCLPPLGVGGPASWGRTGLCEASDAAAVQHSG